MLAYKFRGADQSDFAFDIILNQQLHCAEWTRLNDPMEGRFTFVPAGTRRTDDEREFLSRIFDEKHRWRVCSLSTIFDSWLMWSHYASGFRGLAIEVDLPFPHEMVKRVRYAKHLPTVVADPHGNIPVTAEEVLFTKFIDWKYEKEVRVKSRTNYFRLRTPVRRLIVGHRMEPALLAALKAVCDARGIAVERTTISDAGVETEPA